MSNSKVQVILGVENLQGQKTLKKDPPGFPQDEIRARAYQIYESGNRNGNDADADWGQAETELMELLHAR